jgi:hypothetical protein
MPTSEKRSQSEEKPAGEEEEERRIGVRQRQVGVEMGRENEEMTG